MTKSRFTFFALGYLVSALLLFFYSFTQVDLGLTLTRLSIWQTSERWFQYIGYFNRPLSTYFYLGILFLLFFFFIGLIISQKKSNTKQKQLWILISAVTVVLAFSYNAFSYDLFNYIFDAKIITHYQQNPYIHKALDYQHDPMLSFMHWTHRVYPYGPIWLVLTIPLSFLGAQLFLPTFFLFKLVIAASYVGVVYFLGKIAEKININKNTTMIVFALNPLVVIEGLVSAHNDIVMMFFALWALFMLIEKKYIPAFFLLFLSVGIKFASVFLFPIFFYIIYCQRKNQKISWKNIFLATCVFMTISIVFSVYRTEMQPWYLLWVLPFAALAGTALVWPSIILSFGFLLHYVPFLYSGNWDPPIPAIKLWITTAAIIIASIVAMHTVFIKKVE